MTRCSKSGKIVAFSSLGIFCILSSVLLVALDPIRIIVGYNTRVTNGSYMFELFQKEVEGAHLSLYIFNVTNAGRFMTGEDHALKVEEVGPFTYAEVRKNVDIDLDEDGGEMTFTPRMKLRFLPEASAGRPELVNVTVPNLALLSATSLMKTYPFWIKEGYNLLIRQLGSEAVMQLDVHSYLWGYEDPLIALANKIVPGLIYFDRFGVVDRLYENKTMYRMKVGVTDADRFSIKSLKKYMRGRDVSEQRPLESYNFKNTYEGVSYPPGLTLETPLKIYRLGVCRPLDLDFHGVTAMDYGADTWAYEISDRTFTKDCDTGICGMLDLSNCTYGIPIAMSRTHFLDTNPKIYERIEGMSPDKSKHDSTFLIDPKIGITISTSLSLQMNIVLGDIGFNGQTSKFSNMTLPIAYIKVVQQNVFEDLKAILKFIYVIGPSIVLAVAILFLVLGVGLLTYVIQLIYCKNCDVNGKKYDVSLKEKQAASLIEYANNT